MICIKMWDTTPFYFNSDAFQTFLIFFFTDFVFVSKKENKTCTCTYTHTHDGGFPQFHTDYALFKLNVNQELLPLVFPSNGVFFGATIRYANDKGVI